MWRQIASRESGEIRPNNFKTRLQSFRVDSLQLANHKDIISPHRAPINSLQVDLIEGRYLLSASSDSSVAVFDIQRPTEYAGNGGVISKHRPVFTVDKQHVDGHRYAVSSGIWYPIDTGVFVTGSYDHFVKVWDTNATQVVTSFKMPGKVYRTAMSAVATSHMLIAAASEDVQVRLCDIASGAFAHTLSGHRDGVMAVEWSTSSEWVLITGGCDGAIRLWDIRRAGCFLVLDQSQTQLGKRPPIVSRAVADKASTSKAVPSAHHDPVRQRALKKKSVNVIGMKQSVLAHTPGKVPTRKRLHPGMVSTLDRATAHYGAVTGLKLTEDGMYLLSAGSDSRLRLWDFQSGCNTLVNFETARMQTSKAIQLATSQDPTLAFVPCMTSVKAFDLWSGKTAMAFRGHYEHVNCCWFNPQDQELYTGGNDRQILVWSPSRLNFDEDERVCEDKDNWSD